MLRSHPTLPIFAIPKVLQDTPVEESFWSLQAMLKDQESSSSKSTDQSCHEVSSLGGHNETSEPLTTESSMQVTSLQTPDFSFPMPQSDGFQPVVHIPYTYADAYFGQMVAAYGPQIHTQMYDIVPARIPLPDLAEDEPIYVNAKQYRAILRRRMSRAKLEAQNKMVKARKPYLHESRHLHAMNRARGSGGRFLNINKLQGSRSGAFTRGQNDASSTRVHLSSENGYTVASSTTSSSDVTSVSNGSGDFFRVSDIGSATYSSQGAEVSKKEKSSLVHYGSHHQ